MNRRYSKHFNLSGFKVVYNFPCASDALNTISELCGNDSHRRNANRNTSNLSLQQHFKRTFSKHFQQYICAEDCMAIPSAQTRTWMQYRSSHLRKCKPISCNLFDHSEHVSSIKLQLLRQFPGDSDVN